MDANEELLKSLPPPLVAAMYYRSTDLYMFDRCARGVRRGGGEVGRAGRGPGGHRTRVDTAPRQHSKLE